MHARTNFAAAATLALAMVVAMVGTIWQAESASAGCPQAPCQEKAAPTAALSNTWEASVHQALGRVERGFLQMAGMAPDR